MNYLLSKVFVNISRLPSKIIARSVCTDLTFSSEHILQTIRVGVIVICNHDYL